MPQDFGAIESDYAFFMAHSTEAETGLAEYRGALHGFDRRPVRLLDFGCGTGEFSERLLTDLSWSPADLRLELVEPVARQRAAAARRLARFSTQPIGQHGELAAAPAGYDLIVSNHVLYYVDDLRDALGRLFASLAPGGLLLLAMAGWDNWLMTLWQKGFALLGRAVPFHGAEEVEATMSLLGIPFARTTADYEIRFADTPDNRRRILRFLFAGLLEALPPSPLAAEFDRYSDGANVLVSTQCRHYVARR